MLRYVLAIGVERYLAWHDDDTDKLWCRRLDFGVQRSWWTKSMTRCPYGLCVKRMQLVPNESHLVRPVGSLHCSLLRRAGQWRWCLVDRLYGHFAKPALSVSGEVGVKVPGLLPFRN